MNIESNPASRLQIVLSEIRNANPKHRMLDAWAKVLGVTDRMDLEVPRQLIYLNEMVDDVERIIALNKSLNHKIYLAGLGRIRSVLSPINLHSTKDTVVPQNITPEVMARLEFCAEALQEGWSELGISPDELQEISTEVNSLIELVAGSSLNVALRKALLEALEEVRQSISLYRLYGVKALRKNLQSLLGLVFTEREELKNESANNVEVIERLGRLIDKVDSSCAKAMRIHKAISKPIQFLLGLITSQNVANEVDTSAEESDVLEA
jgi:hypothetical protein